MKKPYFKTLYLSEVEAMYLKSLLEAQDQHEFKDHEKTKQSLLRKLVAGRSV